MSELDFTGERFIPGIKGNIELEHMHRYVMARNLVKDNVVLDIASGEGYGSYFLSKTAKHVYGVDISEESVNHASIKYQSENLEYIVGNCAKIPLDDNSVDIVVSFETIEHHDQHEEMMMEIKRVLKPDGSLIISSPDKHEYSDVVNYTNQYHIKELYKHEFENLLKKYFKYHAIYGQRIVFGSGIFSENLNTSFNTYNVEDNYFRNFKGMYRPLYLIAVASDSDIESVESSFMDQKIQKSEFFGQYIQERDQLKNHVEELQDIQNSLMNERDQLQHHIAGLQDAQNALVNERDNLQNHVSNLETLQSQLIQERDQLHQHIEELQDMQNSLMNERDQLQHHIAGLQDAQNK